MLRQIQPKVVSCIQPISDEIVLLSLIIIIILCVKLIQLLTGKYDNSLLNMFSESDPKFIKAMCKLIASWEGYLSLPDKLIRIHGTQDLVIKCPQVASEKLSAGHLIAMSHPKQCQELIEKQLG